MVLSVWFCPKQNQAQNVHAQIWEPQNLQKWSFVSALSTPKIDFLIMFLKVESYKCNRGKKWLKLFFSLNLMLIKYFCHLHDTWWKWISLLFLLVYFPISSHLLTQVMKNSRLKFLAMQKLLNFEYFSFRKFNEILKI
jgi:hypothetical protein